MDSPLELALRLSIGARYEWVQTQYSGNDDIDDLWRPLLQAVAAHDFAIGNRILELSPAVIPKPNDRASAAVFTGVYALMKRDGDLLQQAVDEASRRKPPAYLKSISLVLEAVAAGSTALFATSINKMLSSYPGYMWRDDIYRLVDPHAIGIYELCRLYSPRAVGDFDTTRKLPWDREYHEWLQTCDDITVHFEKDRVPDEVRSLVVELQPLEWAAQVRKNW